MAIEIPVWTTLTTVVNADFNPTQTPYRRIMSVQTGSRRYVSCLDIDGTKLTRELLPFCDINQAARFLRYFSSVIAKNDIRRPDCAHRPEANYNCHDATDAIVDGTNPAGCEAAISRVQDLSRGSLPMRSPLTRGQRGAVRDRASGQIIHSFVGLGEDRAECLNVLCVGGAVGITGYGDLLVDYYRNHPDVELIIPRPRQSLPV